MNRKKKIKRKIWNVLRKEVAKNYTGNIGNVEILEDRILVHVDNKKLKRTSKINDYNFGIFPTAFENGDIYNLNKPVHYIIENCKFLLTTIHTYNNTTVTFKNCNFECSVDVIWGDTIIFDNCRFEDIGGIYRLRNNFMNINCKYLKLKNNFLINFSPYYDSVYQKENYKFCFNFSTDILEVSKSILWSSDFIKIKSKKTILDDSIIYCKSFSIDSQMVEDKDSIVKATDEALINTTSDTLYIESPIILKNDELIEKDVVVNTYEMDLKDKRQKLVKTLSKIKEKKHPLTD